MIGFENTLVQILYLEIKIHFYLQVRLSLESFPLPLLNNIRSPKQGGIVKNLSYSLSLIHFILKCKSKVQEAPRELHFKLLKMFYYGFQVLGGKAFSSGLRERRNRKLFLLASGKAFPLSLSAGRTSLTSSVARAGRTLVKI